MAKQDTIKTDKTNKKKTAKKKTVKYREWSKLLTTAVIAFFALYGIWCGIEYYRLCKLAIEINSTMPDATLAVTCVTTILGAIVSYLTYQAVLKNSLNKNKLKVDAVTGVVRAIQEADILGAVDNSENDEEDE